jgi:hypothetical protein
MDHPLSYADILKQTVQAATVDQPRLQAIKLYPFCDLDSGHFLILASGWNKQRWVVPSCFMPVWLRTRSLSKKITSRKD